MLKCNNISSEISLLYIVLNKFCLLRKFRSIKPMLETSILSWLEDINNNIDWKMELAMT
jgi:hypothetical protein